MKLALGRRLFLAGVFFVVLIAVVLLSGRGEDYHCPSCNVILISIDTLRADRLGAYGYKNAVTPNVDLLASQGTLFKNMYSQAPMTAPSHMSIMTSLYPGEHRICVFGSKEPSSGSDCETRLDLGIVTLAEVLRAHGYYTQAFTGGAQVHGSLGFERGFYEYHNDRALERFVESETALDNLLADADGKSFFLFLHTYKTHDPYLPERESIDRLCGPYDGPVVDSDEKLLNRTAAALREEPSSAFTRDFFSEMKGASSSFSPGGRELSSILQKEYSPESAIELATFLDGLLQQDVLFEGDSIEDGEGRPVFTYPVGKGDYSFRQFLTFYQPDLTPQDRRYLSCLYDAEIHEMDTSIGKLLSSLGERGLLEDTLIVFTSDHGEEFYEHGGWLHEYLYEEIMGVPLIILGPRGMQEGVTIIEYAQGIDIFPTIVDVLGIDTPPGLRGRSLFHPEALGSEDAFPIYMESLGVQYAVIDIRDGRRYKLIEDHRQQLYSLDDDPLEQRDLIDALPSLAGELSSGLSSHQESSAMWRSPVVRTRDGDEATELREQLESLGYLS